MHNNKNNKYILHLYHKYIFENNSDCKLSACLIFQYLIYKVLTDTFCLLCNVQPFNLNRQ